MMRGGPRLMCSPYLTGSLAVMLVIVSFNYWTVSTENNDLAKKMQELQQQLKTGTNHIESLESEIKDLRNTNDKIKVLKNSEKSLKEEAEKKFKKVFERKIELENEVKEQKSLLAGDEEDAKRLAEEKAELEKEVNSVREELDSVKLNMTTCQAELASERAEKLLVPPVGANRIPPLHLDNKYNLGPGQLPDINPDSVSVVKKETQGMTFHKDKKGHWLPIIVQGDPNMPRAKPNVSVMDLKPGQLRAKKDTLVGAGLSILESDENKKAVLEADKSQSLGISSSSKPVIKPQIMDGGGVLPLPGDNLDNAEDDSQIVQHENGPEGKEEIQDDDQNPDGQIDETVDLDKQLYMVDKNEVEGDDKEETIKDDEENSDDFGTSNEDVGEEKLENLKESLNKEDDHLEPLIK